jgi:hypothetical protein
MEIFTSTTDELFVEPLRKKLNYANMAEMFNKINYFRNAGNGDLLNLK